MTTPQPTAAPPGLEVCRITVEGPASRADLALPVSVPIAELLPALLPHVTKDDERDGTPWVLQRLGEEPLDPDGTPETLGLRHGDVLLLRPENDPLPALHFDDIADGVAHAISNQPGRWRPEFTRRLTITLAVLALAGLAVTVLGSGPGPLTAGVCVFVGLLLAASCVAGGRLGAEGAAAPTAGLAACAFFGLAGLALPRAADGGYEPGLTGLALAVAGVAVVAGALLSLPAAGTVLTTTAAAALGVILHVASGLTAAQAAGVVAGTMFVLGHFAPNLSLRLARLRVPYLPRDAEELQEDIDPEPEERITQRATAAATYLNILSLASAAVYAVAFWLLTGHPGWLGWLLPLVFSCTIMLHARGQTGVLQRVPAVLVGGFGVLLVLVIRLADGGLGDWTTVWVLLLVTAVLLLLGSWRLPTSRLRPLWGHIGDILELLTAIALLPLLLQLLHVYAFFRGLAG